MLNIPHRKPPYQRRGVREVGGMKEHKVKAWAWVYTEPKMQHAPIIAVDERKIYVTEEKRKFLMGRDLQHGKILRSLYRRSKIVPVTITFKI